MLNDTLTECYDQVRRGGDFNTIESHLVSGFMRAASTSIGELLASYDIDQGCIEFDGEPYYQSSRNTIDYFTSAGKVEVARSLYRNPSRTRTICPLNQNVGIVCDHWTPKAAKVATFAVAQMTPYAAETLFTEIGAMAPSKSTLDRLPKRINDHLDWNRRGIDAQIRHQVSIPAEAVSVSVSLDGVHVPIQKLKGKSRYYIEQGFGSDRGTVKTIQEDYSRYREAGCGTISYYNKAGDLLHTHQYGRMPEQNKESLKRLLEDHVREVLDERPALRIVCIADGAKDNWIFLERAFPESIKILDFYHAAEHLKLAMESIFTKASKATEMFEVYRTLLRHEQRGIDHVIAFLDEQFRKNPNNDVIRRELNYFKSNRDRCDYQRIKQQNLPIGSGIVEATCKTLVTQRMKCSGMAWRWKGGQAILNLRAYANSNLFDTLWKTLDKFYRKPVFA